MIKCIVQLRIINMSLNNYDRLGLQINEKLHHNYTKRRMRKTAYIKFAHK